MVVFEDVKKEDVVVLKKLGFEAVEPKTVYEEIRYKKDGVTAVLYTSGKLLLQGKEDAVDKIAAKISHIGHEVKKESFRKESGWIIGSDETLKGDTFGGLVVAAVKADDSIRKELLELGVADSKNLSDKEILVMAEKIKKIAACEVKSILPEEYNKHDKMTPMLNHLHKECAKYLLPGKHVVDKYPGCNVGDVAETKAESKYVEVAAASILARSAGLKQLDFLSMQAGFPIPKGSTHVDKGLHLLQEKGLDPRKFVKMHFRNVMQIFD